MLTVSIFSFSYKKSGIPKDKTSNGGGFVFDCRSIYNPGRMEEFKNLSGLDEKVVNFLDNNEDMKKFIHLTKELVIPVIDNYTIRKFTNLMVCYGCTGGQHRSVYAAEKLNQILKTIYNNINFEIYHTDLP